MNRFNDMAEAFKKDAENIEKAIELFRIIKRDALTDELIWLCSDTIDTLKRIQKEDLCREKRWLSFGKTLNTTIENES